MATLIRTPSGTLSLVVHSQPLAVSPSHPHYAQILEAARAGDDETVLRLYADTAGTEEPVAPPVSEEPTTTIELAQPAQIVSGRLTFDFKTATGVLDGKPLPQAAAVLLCKRLGREVAAALNTDATIAIFDAELKRRRRRVNRSIIEKD